MNKRAERRNCLIWEYMELFGVIIFAMAAGAATYHQYIIQHKPTPEPAKETVTAGQVDMPAPETQVKVPVEADGPEEKIETDEMELPEIYMGDKVGEVFRILTTGYCHGNITATGVKPRVGICAVRSEWIGKTALVWQCNEDGMQGDFLGFWECLDTGFGADSDGDGIGSIQEGRVVDMYFPTMEQVEEWMELTGGRIYIQLLDAEG